MRRDRKPQRGLTLIELLVAISVLAFVAVLGWRGLDGIVRARQALNADLEQTRGMQLAFAQMQSDCASMISRELFTGQAIAIDQGRLRLIRTVRGDGLPTRAEVVTYQVVNGVLSRRESIATRDLNQLQQLWDAAGTNADTSAPVQLQSDVTGFSMRAWANDGKGWRTAAASTADQAAATSAQSVANALSTATTGQSTSPMAAAEAAAAAATGRADNLAYTGLEVVVQLRGKEQGMLKTFLLGSV